MPFNTVQHTENFPVASFLLPKSLRVPVQTLYHFARTADDLADEGEASPQERLEALAFYSAQLKEIESGKTPDHPIFTPLAEVIRQHALPMPPFYALLSAFCQDVEKKRYQTFGELIDYCRRSANPVGQLMLHLFKEATPQNLAFSDGICTALQLINFLQDIEIDWKKDRVYLPQDDLARAGLSDKWIEQKRADGAWQAFMLQKIEQVRKILQGGAPLGRRLSGRFGLEIRMVILGGDRILHHLHHAKGDIFKHRPTLTLTDWFYIVRRGLFYKTSPTHSCASSRMRF